MFREVGEVATNVVGLGRVGAVQGLVEGEVCTQSRDIDLVLVISVMFR